MTAVLPRAPSETGRGPGLPEGTLDEQGLQEHAVTGQTRTDLEAACETLFLIILSGVSLILKIPF